MNKSLRGFAAASVVLLLLTGCTPAMSATKPVGSSSPSPSAACSETRRTAFAQLETQFDARVGVYAVDTGSGDECAYRADERFGFASTYKALAAAALLRDLPAGGLDRRVTFTASDLVTYSPVTEKYVATGMTVGEVADAAIRYSDNTAGNLLLRALGGPNGLDAALRKIGDSTTDSERFEPNLNQITPGDHRDTSTPRTLAADLRKYAVGTALSAEARKQLTNWLVGNTTGATLIRASVPSGWRVGDKTGAGDHATRNDIAVVWPTGRAPIVLAILSDRTAAEAKYDDALVAAAAKIVLDDLGAAQR